MVDETHIPKKVEEEGNEVVKWHDLIFEDELFLKILGEDQSELVEGSAHV